MKSARPAADRSGALFGLIPVKNDWQVPMNSEQDQDTGLIRRPPPRPNRAAPRRQRRTAALGTSSVRVDVDAVNNPLPDEPGVRLDYYGRSLAREEYTCISAQLSESSARRLFAKFAKHAMMRSGGNPLATLIVFALFICKATYL